MPKRFQISEQPIDPTALRMALLDEHAGAFASFEGWVRDHNDGRPVRGLLYESYVALAVTEGECLLTEAVSRFAIVDARCVHRIGELALGEMAVWVGVSSAHREAAFAACRWIIDEVKLRVPIWKHERYVDGDAGWIHPMA
ncbi:MAG: molybdenum cofactor biosynthesis protein MoaE [Lysobacteraceae bacterium]